MTVSLKSIRSDGGGGQPLDSTLTALAGLDSTVGLVEQSGADLFDKRAVGVAAGTSVPTRADADARYAAIAHGHVVADVTGLATALNGKANTTHSHVIADTTGLQPALDAKAAATHAHVIADTTGLSVALDGKAAVSHGHTIPDVAGLQPALDGKAGLNSPAFSGVPTSTTPTGGDSSTKIATTAFVSSAITAGGGYTDEAAQDAIGNALQDSSTIDFTYNDTAGTITAVVSDGSITYAKMQSVSATDRLLGRSTAGAGVVQEIVCTAAGRALLDDASAAAQLTTLGAAAASHSHAQSDITNLPGDLAAKQPIDPTLTALAGLTTAAGLVEQSGTDTFTKRALGVAAATSVPTRADADARYAATVHTHVVADTTGLQGALDAKAAATHTHPQSDVTGLTADLSNKQAADPTLSALAGLDTVVGLLEQTGTDLFGKRALGVGATTSVPTRADADARYAAIAHVSDVANPHSVTKAQVGLSAVPNTDATARANHTGTQLAATVSDFTTATDARIGAASINALADVVVSSPSSGQVLKWDGSAWANGTDLQGTGGGSAEPGLAIVTSSAEFTAALADSAIGTIRLVPGTYVFGQSNTETVIGRGGLVIEGVRGKTFVKAHFDFATSNASEATNKFLWRATGQANITIRGISFRQDTDAVCQSKLCFKNCTNVKVQNCDTEGNGQAVSYAGWDFLFLACSGIEVSGCEFIQGIGGNRATGCRIAGKSQSFKVFNCWFHGKTVTQNQAGSGNQPGGDLWGSVGLNIDCSQVTNTNSNEFKGGKGRIINTEATGGNATVTVTGINGADWRAFIHQVHDPATMSATANRLPKVAITANTLNFSQMPGGGPFEYEYFYFYLGHTPRDGEVYGNLFEGMTWVGCSIINGFDINCHHNIYKHIGDVAWDPEGCFRVHCTDSIFVDCYIPSNPAGYQTIYERNVIEAGPSNYILTLDGSSGGVYQAFSPSHGYSDFGSDQFDGVSITVAAPSGNNQTITGTANCFNYLHQNERIQITHGSNPDPKENIHSYLVTAKASSTNITVDKSTRRRYDQPDAADTNVTIPTATYTAGNWKKYPYLANAYGLTGRVSFRNNKIKGYILGLQARNQIGAVIAGNDYDFEPDGQRFLEAYDLQDAIIELNGMTSAHVMMTRCYDFSIRGGTIARSYGDGINLDACKRFVVENLSIKDADYVGNSGHYCLKYKDCADGIFRNIDLVRTHGDAANASLDINATGTNTNITVYNVRQLSSAGQVWLGNQPAHKLTDQTTKTSIYTLLGSDSGTRIPCTGTWTLTVSAAATLGNGFSNEVINIGSGAITISGPGATDITLSQHEACYIFVTGGVLYAAEGTYTAL